MRVLLDGRAGEQLRRVRQRRGDGGRVGIAAFWDGRVQRCFPAGDLLGGDELAGVGFGSAGALLGLLVLLGGGGCRTERRRRLLHAGTAVAGIGRLHATAVDGVPRSPGDGPSSAAGGGAGAFGHSFLRVVIHGGDLADAFDVLLAGHAARVALVLSAGAVQRAVVIEADELMNAEAGFLGAWAGEHGMAHSALVFCGGALAWLKS